MTVLRGYEWVTVSPRECGQFGGVTAEDILVGARCAGERIDFQWDTGERRTLCPLLL